MRKEQLLGSQTAKNGFANEDDIVEKFNHWQTDIDAQKWLEIMQYRLDEKEFVPLPKKINLINNLYNKTMKIVAFAGSTSSTSINKKLVEHTLTHFGESDINLLDLNDYSMPIFSSDEEKKGTPEQARKFVQCIEEADAIVCSFAEHNGNFAAAFKNVFDWASRINMKVFQNKPMLIMATSPGGYGGKNVLDVAQKTLPLYGGNIKGVFSLPKFGENFDLEKGIINEELKENFQKAIKEFKSQL